MSSNVLALNAGSSSIKFVVFAADAAAIGAARYRDLLDARRYDFAGW